jgi:DNA polymerase-3 subunit beta
MSAKGKYVAKGGFQVGAGELKAALKRFKNVISQKHADEILKHILLHRMGHRLELQGSDGEMYASSLLNVEPIEGTRLDAGLAVPYKELAGYLKHIPDEATLKCVYADDEKGISHILIESEYGQKAFRGIDSHNYPKAGKFHSANIAIMRVDDFRDMLARTLFAADDGRLYPKLNGVYFHCLPDKTRFVATNKHILSMYEKSDLVFTKPESVMVPTKVLQAFMAGIEDAPEDGNVLIYISDGYILLANKAFALFSKCLGNDFPDYERVIPKDAECIATFERESLIKVIKQLLPLAGKKTPRVDLVFDEKGVDVYMLDASCNKYRKESLFCEYSGLLPIYFQISFGAETLLPILENLKSERIVMKMVSSKRPAVIQPEPQDAKAHALCLIAPMLVPR